MSLPVVSNIIKYSLYKYCMLILIGFIICVFCHNSFASQSFHRDIELGFSPGSVIVNQDSNAIYVADTTGNRVAIIDGAVNKVTKTINVIDTPSKLAMNHITNLIYVSHSINKSISVIDILENQIIDVVELESEPSGININPKMNLLYVSQASDDLKDTLLIIDGTNNKTTDIIEIGMHIVEIVFNASSGLIYVLSDSDPDTEVPFDNIVTVIDSNTNKIISSFLGGTTREPSVDIDVNPVTNRIYVSTTGFAVNTIKVFDGENNENIATIDFNKMGDIIDISKIAVNSTTEQIYVIKNRSIDNDSLCLVEGLSNEIIRCIDNVGLELFDIAVNSGTNNVYVADKGTGRLSVFSDNPIIIPPNNECEAEIIDVVPDEITLKNGEKKDFNVKLTSKDGCSVENVSVNARINLLGRMSINISSFSALTGSDGIATFSVTAKSNYGNARVVFSANELKKLVKVNVSRR